MVVRIVGLSSTAALCADIATASAQAVEQRYELNINCEPLDSALKDFAAQTGLQIAYIGDLKTDMSPVGPLKGAFFVDQALTSILARQSLSYKVVNDDTIAVMHAEPPSPRYTEASTTRGSSDGLEEIMVTATRTAESAEKVPISLTAYSNKGIEDRGAHDAADLLRFIPGVTFSEVGMRDESMVSIRGINSSTGSGTVGLYIDDTPIQISNLGYASTNTYPRLFDIDRVEVLRGPQGTLFGAGSEGGTIRFITPQPSLENYSGYDKLEIGSIDGGSQNYEVGAAAGGPILDGKLGFRVSIDYRRDGGYIDRVDQASGATIDKNANYDDAYVLRTSLLWAPVDGLKITPSVMFQETRLNDTNAYWELLSHGNTFITGNPLASPVPDRFTLPALKIEYSLSSFDIISNTSYFSRLNNPTDDYSLGIPGVFAGVAELPEFPDYRAFANFENGFHTFVEEARIQSNKPDAKLHWVAGVYYNQAKESSGEQIIDKDFAGLISYLYGGTLQEVTGVPLLDGQYTYLQDFHTENRELSEFGELGYEILSGLTLTAGLRVSEIKLSASNFVTGAFNFGTLSSNTESSEHAVTPKYNLSWQIDDSNLVYTTVAKGFRPGGTNVSIGSSACTGQLNELGFSRAPDSYDSDSLWSYEIGTKNRIFGGNTEIDASVFHIQWSGIQQSIFLSTCGLTFTGNLGEAISNGFDFQLNQRVGNFVYLAQLGYTDAFYSRNLIINPGSKPLVRDGDALEVQPWTVSLGAQYNFKVSDHDSYARIDYSGRLGKKLEADQDPSTSSYLGTEREVETTNLINARLGTLMNGLNLSLFVTNLANSHPVQTGFTWGGAPYYQDITLVPRTIGVTALYRY